MPFWVIHRQSLPCFNINDRLKFAIHRVKMRTAMLSIIQTDDDAEESAQFGHALRIFVFAISNNC